MEGMFGTVTWAAETEALPPVASTSPGVIRDGAQVAAASQVCSSRFTLYIF